jgi:hypothetical protein
MRTRANHKDTQQPKLHSALRLFDQQHGTRDDNRLLNQLSHKRVVAVVRGVFRFAQVGVQALCERVDELRDVGKQPRPQLRVQERSPRLVVGVPVLQMTVFYLRPLGVCMNVSVY